MEGPYEGDSLPFSLNRTTSVFFHGFSSSRARSSQAPRLLLARKVQFLDDFNLIVNAGLTQARADHPHACKILEIRLDFDPSENCYSVFHTLEAMERDVGREKTHQPYTESDLTTFLKQTSDDLAHAHAKGIAHRDMKPGNIFMEAAGYYKVGISAVIWRRKPHYTLKARQGLSHIGVLNSGKS